MMIRSSSNIFAIGTRNFYSPSLKGGWMKAQPSNCTALTHLSGRNVSSSTSTSETVSTSAKNNEKQKGKIADISWTDYFARRKGRKSTERLGGLLGGLTGLGSGSYYFFAVAEFDPTQPMLGLPDPTVAYVLGALSVGFVGFIGGILGTSALWQLRQSPAVLRALDDKDRELYKRIKKHRPQVIRGITPPGTGGQGVQIPDYYGEKIYSLKDYREWLVSQKKFKALDRAHRSL